MATNDPITRSDFYVYALFRENGVPFYIGKGRGNRWLHHERDAVRRPKGHKAAIIRKMQSGNIEIIKIKLHEGLTETIAHEYEVALIKAIGRGANGPLANATDGGEGVTGLIASPETRAKLSAAGRGRLNSPETRAKLSAINRGKKHSAETRAKIGAVQIGRKPSAEAVANMAAARLGHICPPEVRAKISAKHRNLKISVETRVKMAARLRGRPLTPEHKAKMSEAHKGKKQPPEQVAKRVEAVRRTKSLKRSLQTN